MELPISVQKRPFCVEPITSVMLPDGIFDATFKILDIGFHVTNHSDCDLEWCWVRPASTNLPEWTYLGNPFINLGPIKSGVSRLVRWKAIFAGCTPGKKALDIEFGAQIDGVGFGGGFDGIMHRTIFVCRTTKDELTNTYACEVPEGLMRLKLDRRSYVGGWKSTEYLSDELPREIQVPAIGIVEAITAAVVSNPGEESAIPFNDPWWKIIACVIAAIAGLAALIEAMQGKGTASVGVSGDYSDGDNPQTSWCFPDPAEHVDYKNLAGVLSILSTVAIRVGMMDEMDPIQKGRIVYPHRHSDPTLVEVLSASIVAPTQLVAGEEWRIPIEWTYTATRLSGKVLIEKRDEIGVSDIVARNVYINVPTKVRLNEPIVAHVYLENKDALPLTGDSIFGHVNFISPGNVVYKMPLENVDVASGQMLAPGNFEALMDTEKVAGRIGAEATRGRWRVEFYGQLVNAAVDGLSPFEAATYVGGDFLLSPISLKKADSAEGEGPSKCQPDKTFETLVT